MAITDATTTPQFAHAVRGYDRFQVDEYVARLNEWASSAAARAEHAERRASSAAQELSELRQLLAAAETERPTTPEEALRAASERAAAAVDQALRESADIRRRAIEEGDRLLTDARQQSAELVDASRQAVAGVTDAAAEEHRQARLHARSMLDQATAKAAELVARADADGEAIRRDAEVEQRRQRDAIDRLAAERQQIKRDLGRLRGAIHTLISEPLDADDSGATPADDPFTDDTTVIDMRVDRRPGRAGAAARSR